jgi:hypothetical protein
MVLKAMVFIHTISLSFHGLLTPYLAVKEPVFFVSGSNKAIFKNKDEILIIKKVLHVITREIIF